MHEWKDALIKMTGRTNARGHTSGTGVKRKRKPRMGYVCEKCKLTALPPKHKSDGWTLPLGACSK